HVAAPALISSLPLHDALPILFILHLYLFSKQKADKCTNNENLPASATATLVSSIPSKCSTIHGIDITLNTCDHSLPQILVEYAIDRKSTRLNSSHVKISYAVF